MTGKKASNGHILKLTEGFGELKGEVRQMDKTISNNHRSLYKSMGENYSHMEKRLTDIHNSMKTVIEDHDDRINKLEDNSAHTRGKAMGAALAVSLIVSIGGFLIAFLRGFFK